MGGARVASCQEAVNAVNKHTGADKAALRDVDMPEVEAAFAAGAMSSEAMQRARHVITENERCQRALAAFKERDYAALGKLMHESHQSLKDDYQVTCAELDALVDMAMEQVTRRCHATAVMAARTRSANALARLTPACGPHHHAPGRSRGARYCHA